jgi:hypothetical protein
MSELSRDRFESTALGWRRIHADRDRRVLIIDKQMCRRPRGRGGYDAEADHGTAEAVR